MVMSNMCKQVGQEYRYKRYGSYAIMTERVKVRLRTFLACFIAIATAFVLAEGSGWHKKKSKSEWSDGEGERERGRL